MGLGGGSASSSKGVSNGSLTSNTGSDFSLNSNPLNPATVRMPNNFNFAQQSDPETYNNAQLQKQQASQAQSNRLTQLNQVYDAAQGQGASQQVQEQAQIRPQDTLVDTEAKEYSGIGNNVAVGLNKAYEGLLKIPRFVYSAAAVPQNFLADKLDIPELGAKYENFLELTNASPVKSPLTMLDQLGDYYGEQSEGYAAKTQKYNDTIIGSIGKGEFGQAGSQILDQIAESAPSIAVMAMTSGAGNAAGLSQTTKTLANALPFMSQRNAELQDDESIPEWLKPVNAGFNGLAEVIFDQSFGTQAAIQGIVNKLQNEGREAAVNAAKELTGSFMNGALKTVKVLKPFVKGAVEEGSTQLAQNIVDKYTVNPDIDLMQGVPDAMIVGSAMTGGIETAGNILIPKQKAKIQSLEEQQKSLLNELGNENLTPESRDGIAQMLEDNRKSIESTAKEAQQTFDKLSDTQKNEVTALNEKIVVAENVANDPNASESVKKAAEQQVATLSKEIDAIKPEEGETKPTPTPKKEAVVAPEIKTRIGDEESNQLAATVLQRGIKESDYKPVEDFEQYFDDKEIYNIAKNSGLKVVLLTPEMAQENKLLSGATGKYLYNNTIMVDPEYLDKKYYGANILQHEAAHAFTVSLLQEKNDANLAPLEIEFRDEVKKAFNENKNTLFKPYGLSNELEFVAEFYGNPKFRDYLKNENLPLWRKIIKLITGVLKVDNSKLDKIFGDFKQNLLPSERSEISPDTKQELTDYITQAEEIAVQHEALAEQETDPVEKQEQLEIAKNAREVIANAEQELTTIENEAKTPVVDNKKSVSEIVNDTPEIKEVGTAKQYEKYVDNIFPKSKVKNVLYHSSDTPIDEFKSSDKGIYFSEDKNYWEGKKYTYAVVIDAENPIYGNTSFIQEKPKNNDSIVWTKDEAYEFLKDLDGGDKLKRLEGLKNVYEAVVFDANKIHILGTKEDVDAFRKSKEEVVTEDLSQKRNEEVLTKAETDLKALKQVTDKVKKYDASMKRLTDAKNAKEITTAEFNDLKKRFDDVIGESKPKVEVPVEEVATIPDKEAPLQDKVIAIQDKRQAIKDRISEKLKAQRSNISSGFDPSLVKDFVELGSTYIEEGIVKASDFIKRFREDYRDMGFDDTQLTDAEITEQVYDKVQPQEEDTSEADAKEIGLTKEDVVNLRTELGQAQYTYEVKRDAERIREAKQAIKDGYNIADLIKQLNERPNSSALENEILKQYYASLTTAIGKNPTPELIKQRDDLLKLIDVVKTEGGRSSQAWDGLTNLEDNLANFLTEESRFTTLTQEEINALSEKYSKAKEALEKYQKKQEAALAKAIDKKVKEEIEKAKKNSPKKGVAKEAFREERKKYVEDFRAKLREIRTTPSVIILPYQRELIALAPFVRKMVQSYVNEGVYDLKEIVKGIKEEFVQDIPELTDEDVKDIIAGQYKNTRETKNAKMAQIRDIERQAKLERDIEKLEQGIIETRNPVQKKAKNDKIAALEEEIKQIKKRNPELTEPIRLDARKKWFNTKIEQLKKQIRDGDFEVIEPPLPVLLDNEALKLKDEYMRFKEETRGRRQKLEYDASSKFNKAYDKFRQVLELRRLVQTSIDLSIPLRQGISVMMNVGIPFVHEGTTGLGIEAYQKMLSAVKSKDNYNRLMFDIEHSPEFLQSKDDGIVYAEIGSTNNENRDEHHRQSFLYNIPILRAPFMASERAASAWQNYARYQLYLRGVQMLEAQGKTRANAKGAYEQMAARVMVDTGRGKIPGVSDKTSSSEGKLAKQLLGNTLYGARLASAIFRKLNPFYFFGLPIDKKGTRVDSSVRVQALKDMAGYTSGLLITGLAFVAMGYTVSFDHDDPDFLKARKGKKVIDFTGGQSTYVRTYLRLLTAVYKRADPDVSHEDANKYAKFATASLGTFFRNKLAPNTSYGVNMIMGENTIGEKFNPWEIIQIYPMYGDDIVKSVQEGNPLDLLTIIPVSISGLGYMEYDKDIRKAKLNTHLDKDQDKKVISFLKEHQLNLMGEINQEIYDINTGEKIRMSKPQSDRYEKLWADYIKAELKEPGEIAELSKLSDDKLKKEINKIKLSATKYAKAQVSGVGEGVTTIREDEKTYQLSPEQVKQRIKLNQEYIKENGKEIKTDLIDMYIEDGMSKGKAERKADLEIQKKANAYSKREMIEADMDANDGKITFKEKD